MKTPFSLLGLFFLSAAFPLAAQYETASVLGTITDPSGAALEGSQVTLENTETGVRRTTRSDDQGNYYFLDIRIGTFTVAAETTGFKVAKSDVFDLRVSARQRVDLKLEVGEVSQTVTVEAAAMALETESSDRGQVVQAAAIVNLPLNGRAYADLALLSPGVRRSTISTSRDASFNVNGLRSAHNNFLVDGVDNNAYGTSNQGFSNQVVQLNPDAVEEFRVQTNNYSAEYGRAGGAVINASIRSGTNAFHGSAWEFLRNTKLNAVGFFRPASGVKPVLVQNQFGASFGGPIQKDKLFFFVDYEGFRRVERGLDFASIPSLEQRQGLLGIPVRNPFTGEVYSDGVIPTSALSPFALRVLRDLPSPIRSSAIGAAPSNNWEYLTPVPTQDDKGDVRLDYYMNDKLRLSGRYSHRLQNRTENHVIPGPSGGNANGNVRVLNKQVYGGFNYNVSATSLLDVRFAATWTEGGKTALGSERPGMLQEYGIPGLPDNSIIGGGLTAQSINGFTALGRQSSNPQFQNPFVVNPKVNYSTIIGRHSMKAGYEYQAINTDIFDFNPQYGQDTYSGQFSRPSGVTAPPAALYNLADFLFGARSAYTLNNEVVLNYRQRMHFLYLQDDFKLFPKLTLNLGVRYEFATPQWDEQNRISNFDPIAKTLLQAKDGEIYDRALVHPDRNNWAPRVGLAYQLGSRTVVRSGYGLSYIHFNRLGGENLLGYNGPHIVNVTIAQNPSSPLCSGQNYVGCFRTTQMGYPTGLTSPSNFSTANTRTNYTPGDNPTTYIQSWHFTIQHEIARNLIFDIAYVGNSGVNLMILGDYNQPYPGLGRPYFGFGFIQVSYGGGTSNYHGLQMKLEKRYANGFYLLNSFTYSKAIDYAAGHLESANGDNSRVNIRNLRNDRGVGSYNQPFNNTTTVVYEVPFGRGRRFGNDVHPVADAVLGGWRLTGINTMTSGSPLNVTYSAPSSVQAQNTYRPNYVGGEIYTSSRDAAGYLNRGAFALPPSDPALAFGNVGRNIARAPSIFNLDMGVHKQFALPRESTALEFRTEFFNILNRTNLGSPNGNLSSNAFGTITGLATTPRQIQFALKLLF